jgi:polar amino acid transport system ATP-binding protein
LTAVDPAVHPDEWISKAWQVHEQRIPRTPGPYDETPASTGGPRMTVPGALPATHNASGAAAEAIHIENLHKKFGQLHVLKGVSLSARDGDVVAVIGGSGSGKSTLLRCINCLENPTSGIIRVNGEQIRLKADSHGNTVPADRRQIERIRSRLGMVFQSFNLWTHMTLIENIIEVPIHVLGAPRAEAIVEAERLLERVGLSEKRDVYPAFLSGGQQQRGAIARALAIKPRVMLFDEPTSALDPELVGEVLKVIADLAIEGRTMILVTHEMKFAREVATHVVYLYNGLVEEQGPPETVFGAPKSERLKQFLRNVN